MAKNEGFHNNGLMLRLLPLLFLATACTTVSSRDSAKDPTDLSGIVATGTHFETANGNKAQLGTYVQVRGTVMCANGSMRRPTDYRADIIRQGKPVGATELDQRLSFDLLKLSPYGAHEARLVEKRTGRVLDRHTFNTSAAEDRFDIVFADCQPKKTN